VLATVNLDWMSKVMSNLGGRAGITAVLVDSAGTVLAAPADQHSAIGRPLDNLPLMSAIADKALRSDQDEGSLSFLAADGSRRAPKSYQVVSEARFEAYRTTGILPPDTPEDRALEIAAGGHPADPDPAGPAGNTEAVLATGAAATNGPDGATGGDAEVDKRPADEN